VPGGTDGPGGRKSSKGTAGPPTLYFQCLSTILAMYKLLRPVCRHLF